MVTYKKEKVLGSFSHFGCIELKSKDECNREQSSYVEVFYSKKLNITLLYSSLTVGYSGTECIATIKGNPFKC